MRSRRTDIARTLETEPQAFTVVHKSPNREKAIKFVSLAAGSRGIARAGTFGRWSISLSQSLRWMP